jgi:hypothetical protein
MEMINYLYQDEKELIFKIRHDVYQLSKTDENHFCLSVIDSIDEIRQKDLYFDDCETLCRYIGEIVFK